MRMRKYKARKGGGERVGKVRRTVSLKQHRMLMSDLLGLLRIERNLA